MNEWRIRGSELPLTPQEMERLSSIRWAREIPHPDGGVQPQFGLARISIPQKGGHEVVRRERSGRIVRSFSPTNPYIVGDPDSYSLHTGLEYTNLHGHDRINAYLAGDPIQLEECDPGKINAIGELIYKADLAFTHDDTSREILAAQKNIVTLFERQVQSGIIRVSDATMRTLVEEAAIHLQRLEVARKLLPSRIRDLIPQAEELGIHYISERCSGQRGKERIFVDPSTIAAVYTPDSDLLTPEEFADHSRKVLANQPALEP